MQSVVNELSRGHLRLWDKGSTPVDYATLCAIRAARPWTLEERRRRAEEGADLGAPVGEKRMQTQAEVKQSRRKAKRSRKEAEPAVDQKPAGSADWNQSATVDQKPAVDPKPVVSQKERRRKSSVANRGARRSAKKPSGKGAGEVVDLTSDVERAPEAAVMVSRLEPIGDRVAPAEPMIRSPAPAVDGHAEEDPRSEERQELGGGARIDRVAEAKLYLMRASAAARQAMEAAKRATEDISRAWRAIIPDESEPEMGEGAEEDTVDKPEEEAEEKSDEEAGEKSEEEAGEKSEEEAEEEGPLVTGAFWDSDRQSTNDYDESDWEPSQITVEDLMTRLDPLVTAGRPYAQTLLERIEQYAQHGGRINGPAEYPLECLTLNNGEYRLASAIVGAYCGAYRVARAQEYKGWDLTLDRLDDSVALCVADVPPLPTDTQPVKFASSQSDVISIDRLVSGAWTQMISGTDAPTSAIKELQQRLHSILDAGFHGSVGGFNALSVWPPMSPEAWAVAVAIKKACRVDDYHMGAPGDDDDPDDDDPSEVKSDKPAGGGAGGEASDGYCGLTQWISQYDDEGEDDGTGGAPEMGPPLKWGVPGCILEQEKPLLEFLSSFSRARLIHDQLYIIGRESFYGKYPFLLDYVEGPATAAAVAGSIQELQSTPVTRVILKRLRTEGAEWIAPALQRLMGSRPVEVLSEGHLTRLHDDEEPGGMLCDLHSTWPPQPPHGDSFVRMSRRGLLFNTSNVSVVGDEILFAGLGCFLAMYPFMRDFETVPVSAGAKKWCVTMLNNAKIYRAVLYPRPGDNEAFCASAMTCLMGPPTRSPIGSDRLTPAGSATGSGANRLTPAGSATGSGGAVPA